MPSPVPPPDRAPDLDFDRSLMEIEQALLMLKARYAQVQLDQRQQQDLQLRLSEAEQQRRFDRSRALSAEIKHIKNQLDELELALESRLFSWNGLREPFWQAVRFGGIGIVIGWLLKSYAGG